MRTDLDHSRLPTGTVTFMFTDIEGSTRVLQTVGSERYAELLEEHNRILRRSIVDSDGLEVSSEGDSLFAVFTDPKSAIEAAMRIQKDLTSADWGGDDPIRVRIGLHTGSGLLGADNYVGVDVHKASRISSAAHGGQIAISDTTARVVGDRLPDGAYTEPLGRYRLSGFAEAASVHQVSVSGLEDQFPPLRAAPAESQLPVSLTDFVGRAEEIELGLEILGRSRLLTLTGPGGTGKTRLSLEIARMAEPEFPDGAYFVPLASIKDPSLISMTILDTLKLKTAGGVEPLEHLLRFMTDRSLLIVLDNFEQLLAGASVVTDLLSGAPGLSVIVTSRSPLRASGERELPVPPLAVPDRGVDVASAGHTEGIQLFVNRAEALRPDFALTGDNVSTVAEIVRALDGLPLAIELAASRLRSLTPELVLERLGNQLLKSQSADVPARQQTIVNAISWSYDLLDEQHKLLFEKLSVFSGTFGLDEVELVCGVDPDPLDGITELVEQSLIRQTERAGSPRYRMLTVIREFAFGALVTRGLDQQLLGRHATVYADLAERADAEILTSHQAHWLTRLSDDHENLRAAFDQSIDTAEAGTALRLAGALWRFWQIRGYLSEARQRLESALALPAKGHEVARAQALAGLGGILYWLGRWDETRRPYSEALELFREHGMEEEISEALYNLSFAMAYTGSFDEAEGLLRESLDLSESIGRRIGVGRAHWGLGDVAVYREEWDLAIGEFEQSVEEFSSIDAPFDLGWAWFMLAHSYLRMGRPADAGMPLRESLEIFAKVGDVSALTLILELLAGLVLAENDRINAAYLIGAAHRLQTDTGVAIGDVDFNQYPPIKGFLDSMDETSKAAYDEGYNAVLSDVVDEALAILSR